MKPAEEDKPPIRDAAFQAILDAVPPDEVVLVSGSSGFMGSYLVHLLCEAGCRQVHGFDVQPPRQDLPNPRATHHLISLLDEQSLEGLFAKIRPRTVYHVASMIDCRPIPDENLERVNVGGTQFLLECARKHQAQKFIYTSSIDVMCHNNSCDKTSEDHPYPSSYGHDYNRTKIAAERLVLAANSNEKNGLKTCAIRPGHVYGAGDMLLEDMSQTPVAFGCDSFICPKPAQMSMSHVENVCAAHLLAAAHLDDDTSEKGYAGGRAFNVADYDNNISIQYHDMAGAPPPVVTLPVWILWIVVKLMVCLSVVIYKISGYQIMGPVNGIHEAAMGAGLTCTMDCTAAKRDLGYRPYVSRSEALQHCQAWFEQTMKIKGSTKNKVGDLVAISPILKKKK